MADPTPTPAPSPFPTAQAVADAQAVIAAAQAAPKPFWKSKTFWANALIAGSHYFGYLPAQATPYVLAGANILLRFLTVGPVTLGQ